MRCLVTSQCLLYDSLSLVCPQWHETPVDDWQLRLTSHSFAWRWFPGNEFPSGTRQRGASERQSKRRLTTGRLRAWFQGTRCKPGTPVFPATLFTMSVRDGCTSARRAELPKTDSRSVHAGIPRVQNVPPRRAAASPAGIHALRARSSRSTEPRAVRHVERQRRTSCQDELAKSGRQPERGY